MADVLRPRKRPQRIEDEARIGEGSTRSPDNVNIEERKKRERAEKNKKIGEMRAARNIGAKIDTDARAAPSKVIRDEDAASDTIINILFGDDKPVKKAKGGMIGTKRYMNGGMVMPGRGVRDTKMG